jgi:N-acetylmuramoyl-L-alanine amidase
MADARAARRSALALVLALTVAAAAVTARGVRPETGSARAASAASSTFLGPELGRAANAVNPAPLVCIDPGHSLSKPSIVVTVPEVDERGRLRDSELREVDINLDIAREVARRLGERFGADAVVMTWGETDNQPRGWNALRGPLGDEKTDVMARGAFCTGRGARAIVSIHTNSFGDSPNGMLTGYRDANDRALALAVHAAIRDAVAVDPAGRPLRDFSDYGLDQGEWFLALGVDDRRDVPTVILEPVMMSDADEARRLLPTVAEAPRGRRAQIAGVAAQALGDWIESALLVER